MANIWHDINLPNVPDFVFKKGEQKKAPVEEPQQAARAVDQVKVALSEGKFSPGANGYAFNESCTASVKAEITGKPQGPLGQVTFKLFSRFENKEEDHRHSASAAIHDGAASADLKLFYNSDYYDAGEPSGTTVEYFFRASHPKASSELQSETLTMPRDSAAQMKLRDMAWQEPEALVGEEITLNAHFDGASGNVDVEVEIYRVAQEGEHELVDTVRAEIRDGALEETWEVEAGEGSGGSQGAGTDESPGESGAKETPPPKLFFVVKAGEGKWGEKQESGLLEVKEWLEIELADESGKPLADEEYVVKLPGGREIKGTLDKNGFARIEGVSPGDAEVEFPNQLGIDSGS